MPELPLVGDEFAGYQLRSVLGRGGMSVVYQAENPRLGSLVALKVLAPELATDNVFRARFLEESRIAASLNHPNVIPIYDMGSSADLLYIAMRYVSGTDLRQMIKKRGRILPSTAVFLVSQAARALDAAHRRGLVHRDVKPGNLLIERGIDEDDPEHVYLADFGITKHAMSRTGLTSTGQFLGTVDYVAPEQIRGMSVLGLADQYSLGCVLYECLTGRVPFEKDLDAAIIWAHVEETPTMPSALRPELPQDIDHVFARVLSKQPGDRYQSCREFMEAVRVALGDLAVDPRHLDRYTTGPAAAGHSGVRTGPPSAGVPSAGQPSAGAPWAGHRSGPLAEEPVTERIAVASQAARAPESEANASRPWWETGAPSGQGGQPAGGQPPPGAHKRPRRGLLRPRWLAVLAALILAVAGVGTWALVRGSGSHHHTTSMPSMAPKEPKTSALMNALALANKSSDAKGYLPPSSCIQQGTTKVTCTGPASGINQVVFQTYPSLPTLYDAYTAQVRTLNNGQFQANFADCGKQMTFGEVGWNHMFEHPKTYSIQQMSSGMVTDGQAAGRVFCNFNNGQENMVWTQDSGRMLAYVSGPVHEDVWNWWVAVHHNIGFTSAPMHM
jgi:serine/threonine-protein kinase